MQLVKKISVLALVLFLYACSTTDKAAFKPTPPIGFRGTWILDEYPTTKITFDPTSGTCSYLDTDGDALSLTPIEQFKFTDKPAYPAYIYEFKIQTKQTTMISYIILWTDDTADTIYSSDEKATFSTMKAAKNAVSRMKHTYEEIQDTFATKENNFDR